MTEALNEDFRDLLLALLDAEAEFVLIGGWALAAHGHGRGTDDMDVLVRPSKANARRVVRALTAFGAPVAAHGVTPELFAEPGYGYRMGIRPNLIELLTIISGLSYDDAASDCDFVQLRGRQLPVMSRRALLKNKLAAGRPKDLADVEWLTSHAAEGGDPM